METPLSPLDFARRTRRLHANREAVVDGDLRLTYRQFFDRCDRWSSALQGLGVAQGDRVATISPNTHAQLESFYAVPQLGAVLVPINYRLTAEELRDGGSATEEEIISFARERLAHFKAPRGVTLTGELPKTATGKIQKYVLRKGSLNLARQ
jgi:acyl-CoA synthetase (AMP-forming)/AMP-acid ligase II